MGDHRIVDPSGIPLPFSCENRRFATNTEKGFSHTPNATTRGSVLNGVLVDYGDSSLWLEHALDKDTREELYWLMWYDRDGIPKIPASGVFGKNEVQSMVRRLTAMVL